MKNKNQVKVFFGVLLFAILFMVVLPNGNYDFYKTSKEFNTLHPLNRHIDWNYYDELNLPSPPLQAIDLNYGNRRIKTEEWILGVRGKNIKYETIETTRTELRKFNIHYGDVFYITKDTKGNRKFNKLKLEFETWQKYNPR